MNRRIATGLVGGALAWVLVVTLAIAQPVATEVPFTPGLEDWLVEQVPGGTMRVVDGALSIEDRGGCTVWWRERLTAPVEISYEVTVVARGGPLDRVSDVNCFWMASDPRDAARMPSGRSGRFGEYDALQTYYVGLGGNENTTTRFRRYLGDGRRPLLPEHDLQEKRFLLEPNRTYRIKLVARDGVAEYWRDGERLFRFEDPTPLATGWFGFRTVHAHLEIRNLCVQHGVTSVASSSAGERRLPAGMSGREDRQQWCALASRLAEPVLSHLARRELKARMPVEAARPEDRAQYTHLEALGRVLVGLAPWLELGDDGSPEGRERARLAGLARGAFHRPARSHPSLDLRIRRFGVRLPRGAPLSTGSVPTE